MELVINRFVSRPDFTLGRLSIDGKFQCYTLEDEYRDLKVHGETRIPDGSYPLELQTAGKKHGQYLNKFGLPWHMGMLHVMDVPGFAGIMIHIGNTDEDSDGCPLVGTRYDEVNGKVFNSLVAYKELYPIVREALLKGEAVWLRVMTTPNEK